MTDKIKKLEPLTEDVQPEFPTLSRGGYVEDTVDDWLSTHLREVNEIIRYQNYGVDVVDALENELETAHATIRDLQNNVQVTQAGSSENVEALHAELAGARNEAAAVSAALAAANAELAAAKAQIAELQTVPVKDSATLLQEETLQASVLLQQAAELGAKYVEQAKADGEQIKADAEATLVDLRLEIEDLNAQRFATFRSLEDFFSQELTKLRANNLFATEAEEEETPEVDAPVAVGAEDVAGEEDVPANEVVTPDAVEVEAVETDEDATPVEADSTVEGDDEPEAREVEEDDVLVADEDEDGPLEVADEDELAEKNDDSEGLYK